MAKGASNLKGLGIILLSAVFLLGFSLFPKELALKKYNKGTYTFYYSSGNFKTVLKDDAKRAKVRLKDIKGESVSFERSNLTAEEIIGYYKADLRIVEQTGDITCYYAYSKEFEGAIGVKGENINLHIAVSEDRISIGTPIIFGGF